MKRSLFPVLVGTSLLLATSGLSQNPQPAEVPKLIVRLHPARGVVVPLAPAEPAIYTFEVVAMDEEQTLRRISDEVFVRDGQTRRVQKRMGRVEINGVVSLQRAGAARYQAQLLMDGRRIAATEASLEIGAPR